MESDDMHENSNDKPGVETQPVEPAPALHLDTFWPYRMSVLSQSISTAIAGAYAKRFELSIPEWRVMVIVARFPGISANEVAERSMMDKVAVSRAVSRLLEAGRVRREVAAEDRRRSMLNLTSEGRALYDEVIPFGLDYERELISVFSEQEIQLLDELIERMQSRARELGPVVGP